MLTEIFYSMSIKVTENINDRPLRKRYRASRKWYNSRYKVIKIAFYHVNTFQHRLLSSQY